MFRTASAVFLVFIFLLATLPALCQEEDPYRRFDDINRPSFPPRPVRPAVVDTASARLNNFVDGTYYQYYQIGQGDGYTTWNDYSDEADSQRLAFLRNALDTLRRDYGNGAFDDEARYTYVIFESFLELQIDLMENNLFSYPLTHRDGPHISLPLTLINYQTISNENAAAAYVSRMRRMAEVFDDVINCLETRADRGIILPKFLIPEVIDTCRRMTSGAPFDDTGDDCLLLADFSAKLNAAVSIPLSSRSRLSADAGAALLDYVGPAYERLISCLQGLESRATENAGVWKFPGGDDYYRMCLGYHTTTDLSPKKVHKRGLRGVRRIHRQMRRLMQEVGFEGGNLSDFFEFLRTDAQFYYKNTEQGRNQCLQRIRNIITAMDRRLSDMFITLPQAPLEVRAVESWREREAASAFYTRPSLDGGSPGLFYINLFDTRNQPIFELESLSYHEGIPGHHLQIAVTQESRMATYFRRLNTFTAFVEGWALYAEEFPREFGFYDDPYSEFGRLSSELWRACRLVVDTGIHHYKWTREEALQYLVQNTPASEDACRIAVDRYIVMPAQATAYMIGKLKIAKLRSVAEKRLGESFDLRRFHELIVTSGAMPLGILQQLVEEWLEDQLAVLELREAA